MSRGTSGGAVLLQCLSVHRGEGGTAGLIHDPNYTKPSAMFKELPTPSLLHPSSAGLLWDQAPEAMHS